MKGKIKLFGEYYDENYIRGLIHKAAKKLVADIDRNKEKPKGEK